MRKSILTAVLVAAGIINAFAVSVTVKMNAISTTMSLKNKSTNAEVNVGTPSSKTYTFTADAGTYILTGYATDGSTVNGTIEIEISSTNKSFEILTVNLQSPNNKFNYGTDYTCEPNLTDKNGNAYVSTIGQSLTAGIGTLLVLKDSKSNIDATPTSARAAEGFQGTQDTRNRKISTNNTTVTLNFKQIRDFTITVPNDAYVQLGTKTADYVPLSEIAPDEVTTTGSTKVYHYTSEVKVFGSEKFFRVWGNGYCTQGGLIEFVVGMENRTFTKEDLQALSPSYINHDVTANDGYNVADVYVNVNAQGHLKMNVGNTRNLLAQRTWQLTNSITDNYYVDPDYRFKVVNLNGEEDASVIQLERSHTTTDPWTRITAVGAGTAIVLVTYDAMQTHVYEKSKVSPYVGGTDWSAIWPENTGVFVVTVGDPASGISRNMYINEGMNSEQVSDMNGGLAPVKLAGNALDAENDVIYYVENDGHADYTFTPSGVSKVEIAYPVIGANSVSYGSFSEVARAGDGSYTVELHRGRNIVRLTNGSGVSEYQVITAKPCIRTVSNFSRPGQPYRAGDKIRIQYSGLYHPMSKLSRIYNQSAYINYNGVSNDLSEYGGAGQYTFASVSSAQEFTYTIPLTDSGEQVLIGGCILTSGYGLSAGGHRLIDRTNGIVISETNYPNVKATLGRLPEYRFSVTALPHHTVRFTGLPAGAVVTVQNERQETLTPASDGSYDVVYGSFTYHITASGYAPAHSAFTVSMTSASEVLVPVVMTATGQAWNGSGKSEPATVSGVYQISTPAELAWLAQTANTSSSALNAVLTADLDLGGHNWTAIGTSSKPYLGVFDGQGHTIRGLKVNASSTMQGLFGKVSGTVRNLTVEGDVQSSSTQTGGIAGNLEAGRIENCHFRGTITADNSHTGGIVGYIGGAKAAVVRCSAKGLVYGKGYSGGIAGNLYVATDTIRDCYNQAAVSGTSNIGGIVGNSPNTANIKNVYNAALLMVRPVTDTYGNTSISKAVGAICGNSQHENLTKGYAMAAYAAESASANKTVVLDALTCADGTLAASLGWGQSAGIDPYPVLPENKRLTFSVTPAGATVTLTNASDEALTADGEGVYTVASPGTYHYTVTKEGYNDAEGDVTIDSRNDNLTTVVIELEVDNTWDGSTAREPELVDGWYIIRSGYNLKWFANTVNGGTRNIKGKLANDISLESEPWTPIGGTASGSAFSGKFDGQGHTISGLYINNTSNRRGLFSYVSGDISNLTVEGEITTTGTHTGGIVSILNGGTISHCINRVTVSGGQYIGGVVGYSYSSIDHCANEADVTATNSTSCVGGIAGYAYYATVEFLNCYNHGNITGKSGVGGICGYMRVDGTIFRNVYNTGVITATNATNSGAIHGHGTGTYDNQYASCAYGNDLSSSPATTILPLEDFESGKAAYLLGSGFGQEIGTDMLPVIEGMQVYQYDNGDESHFYSNLALQCHVRDGLTAGRISTVCIPYASHCVRNATFYRLVTKDTDMNGDAESVTIEEVTELEAGMPYVFIPESDRVLVYYTEEDAAAYAGEAYGLHGTYVDITDGAEGSPGNVLEGNYMLVSNKIRLCGGHARLAANRAYIVMSEVPETGSAEAPTPIPGRRRIVVGRSDEPSVVTGLEDNAGAEPKDNEMYDVLGRRVSGTAAHGIYIINGKKIAR